jgi:hypothetical protein
MLSQHLAELYGVSVKALNQAVRRNRERFPDDFAFTISSEELDILKSQIVTSSWGGPRTLPYAFTEQGVAMLSSVLRSQRAIQVNVAIMRAFVQLRQVLGSHAELARKLAELEKENRRPRHHHPFPVRSHPPAHGPATARAQTRNRLPRKGRHHPLPR